MSEIKFDLIISSLYYILSIPFVNTPIPFVYIFILFHILLLFIFIFYHLYYIYSFSFMYIILFHLIIYHIIIYLHFNQSYHVILMEHILQTFMVSWYKLKNVRPFWFYSLFLSFLIFPYPLQYFSETLDLSCQNTQGSLLPLPKTILSW